MTYPEAIKRLRSELQGNLGELAKRADCTQPTVTSAFSKTDPKDLTKTERRVIDTAFKVLAEQKSVQDKWGQTIIEQVTNL